MGRRLGVVGPNPGVGVYATHESLSQATSEEDRMALHGQLMGLWKEALASGHALDVDWSGWNNAVVDLGEDDERLLVFTWNVELDDRTQRYGGWVAHAAPDNALGYTYTMLEHDRNVDPQDDSRMHRHDHWQGGLYYAGVLQHDRDDPVYTLLAWDGADALTTRKWIETVEPATDVYASVRLALTCPKACRSAWSWPTPMPCRPHCAWNQNSAASSTTTLPPKTRRSKDSTLSTGPP